MTLKDFKKRVYGLCSVYANQHQYPLATDAVDELYLDKNIVALYKQVIKEEREK